MHLAVLRFDRCFLFLFFYCFHLDFKSVLFTIHSDGFFHYQEENSKPISLEVVESIHCVPLPFPTPPNLSIEL